MTATAMIVLVIEHSGPLGSAAGPPWFGWLELVVLVGSCRSGVVLLLAKCSFALLGLLVVLLAHHDCLRHQKRNLHRQRKDGRLHDGRAAGGSGVR